MKFRGLLAAVVTLAGASAGAHVFPIMEPAPDRDLGFGPGRRSKGKGIRRGNGIQAKPKKRRNMLTVSKRVRRKHRRAA